MSDLRLLEIDYATPPTDGQSAVYNLATTRWKPSSLTATSITGLTANAVLFGSAAGNIGQDAANFSFNDTTNRLSLGTASDYTARVNILVSGATEKGLAIRLAGSQSANALEVQNNSGTVLGGLKNDGSLIIPNVSGGTFYGSDFYTLSAKGDGTSYNYAYIVDRNRSQTNSGQGVALWLKDNTSYVGMRMWANTFVQNLYDFEFFSQLGLVLTMPYNGGMYLYNPVVNTQNVSCMQVPAQTIYAGAGAADPGGLFVFNAVTLAATSPNTINDAATLLLKGAPIAGVNMTLTRRYNLLSIANQATDVTACYRGTTSQTGHLSQWEDVNKTPLALINKDGGFTFNESGVDTDCRIEGDTDTNLFYTDASTDRVGFGTATPSTKVEVAGVLSVKQGLSSSVAHVGGAIFDHYADVKSVTTGETDLYSDTLPASTLGTNGDKLEGVYSGIVVTHATATRRIKLYFGGNVIYDTGALVATTSGAWILFVHLIRVSSTVIRYALRFDSQTMPTLGEPSITGELTGLTLSNTNVIKVTGQAGGAGAASDDIWVRTGKLKWVPAA